MTTYSIQKSKKRLVNVVLPLCLSLFVGVLILSMKEDPDSDGVYVLISFFAACIFFMLVFLRFINRYCITIDNDAIQYQGIRGVRMLPLKQIKGVIIDSRSLTFVPARNFDREIRVKASVERFDELCNWALQRYEQLPSKRRSDDKEAILNDPKFGFTREERAENLKSAARRTRILNLTAFAFCLTTIFFPIFSRIQVAICIFLPLLAIVIVRMSGGLVHFDGRKDSSYPCIFPALLFPSAALIARSIYDFSIYRYSGFWIPWLTISVLVMAMMLTSSEFAEKRGHWQYYAAMLGIMCIVGMYSYGVVVETNAIFSKGKTKHYKAVVLNKRVSYHKSSKSYYLKLSPWGPQKSVDDVSVSKSIFESMNASDTVDVQFRSGLYGIEYFRVRQIKR